MDKNIPVLLIDFDSESVDADVYLQAQNIYKNLKGNIIYFSSATDEKCIFSENVIQLPSWHLNPEEFCSALESLDVEEIQLAGIYRELCIVKVVSLIAHNTSISSLLLDDDSFFYKCYVQRIGGDTLERRMTEEGLKGL